MARERKEWFLRDCAADLEQITFGEKIQSYAAADERDGQPVTTVMTYVDISGIDPLVGDTLVEAYIRTWPGTLGAYAERPSQAILHQYLASVEEARERLPAMEERMREMLERASRVTIAFASRNDPHTS